MMPAMPLQASVLVLNRSFVPVNLVTVQRAFGMLFADSAQVVLIEDGQMGLYDLGGWLEASEVRRVHKPQENHQEWVCTVSFAVEVPRIVRVLSYNRYPESRVSLSRRNILARDEHRCQYCGRTFSPAELSVDHVVPLSRGGAHPLVERRLRLPPLQPPERRQNAARGRHEAAEAPGRAALRPAGAAEAAAREIPFLAHVLQRPPVVRAAAD